MTPTIFWALLTATMAFGVGIATFIAVGKTRAKARLAPKEPARRIHEACVAGGHNYKVFNTGYRCATCGNHISSHEGELYGRTEDGRQERRREPR